MRAPAGMELLSEGLWNHGSVSGEWSPGGCGCGSGEPCSCGGSCGCKGEGGGSCGGGKPSGEVPLLPDYDGEIWASPVGAVASLTRPRGGLCGCKGGGDGAGGCGEQDPQATPCPCVKEKDLCSQCYASAIASGASEAEIKKCDDGPCHALWSCLMDNEPRGVGPGSTTEKAEFWRRCGLDRPADAEACDMALSAIRENHPVDWPPQEENPTNDILLSAPAAMELNQCRNVAVRATSVFLGGPDLDGTAENGYKHCVGACCLTAKVGPRIARYYLDLNEVSTMEWVREHYRNDPQSIAVADQMRQIDNLNNRLGLSFGMQAVKCEQPSNCCARMCLCAFHRGQMATS